MLHADAKSSVLLRVPPLTKVAVRNFPLLHFSRWICLIHGQLVMPLQRVKRSVICKCQCFCLLIFKNGQFYLKHHFIRHRNSPLEEIPLRSIAASLFTFFFHQNTRSATFIYIYSILGEHPKKNVLY